MGSKVNRKNGSNFFYFQFSSNLDLKSFSPAIASYLKSKICKSPGKGDGRLRWKE